MGFPSRKSRLDIIRYEAQSGTNPEGYRAGVLAGAILGYACILRVVPVLPVVLWRLRQ